MWGESFYYREDSRSKNKHCTILFSYYLSLHHRIWQHLLLEIESDTQKLDHVDKTGNDFYASRRLFRVAIKCIRFSLLHLQVHFSNKKHFFNAKFLNF